MNFCPNKISLFLCAVIVVASVLLITQHVKSETTETPPTTEIKQATDNYHGVDVVDNYRWLEDFENSDVKKWNASQNQYTRNHLDNVASRKLIKKLLTELLSANSSDYYYIQCVNKKKFAFKDQPPKEQPLLITLESVDDPSTERVILDIGEVDPDGTTSIDFYTPSHDAKLIAVSLSKFGSEIGDVVIYNVETGERMMDSIPRVNGPTAGGSVAWNSDNSGFYYTRYPSKGERPDEDLLFYQQVYFHTLGTDVKDDVYAIGKEFPNIAEIELEASHDGHNFIATVSNGDGGEYAHYLLNETGEWITLTKFSDLI